MTTTSRIAAKIARAIQIKQIIANLDEEFKEIKAELLLQAEARHEEQTLTEGGGWSWEHPDSDGNIVRVTKPAPKLKSKLDPEAKGFDKIKEIAGRAFMNLFMQTPSYSPVEEFRIKALAHLSKDDAKKLIKLVTTESAPTVSFEVAKNEA